MKKALVLGFFLVVFTQNALACDYCSIFTPLYVKEHQAGSTEVGVREDLLGYSKTKQDGNDANALGSQNQKVNVTELTAQYAFTDRVSILLAAPIVDHNIKRRENGIFETDSESGVGDVALYSDIVLARKALGGGGVFQWDFFAGAKLPTGNTDRLNEVSQDRWSQTGIYGGAVTVGTGSVDVPLATGIHSEFNTWLVDALIQYNLRSEGDKNYQFGNDLRWNFGFGRRFYEDHDLSIDAELFLNGLSKERDTQNGLDVSNSGQSFIAFGPKVDFLFNNRYLLYFKIDAPITSDNDGLQTLQDHRVQIGFNARL